MKKMFLILPILLAFLFGCSDTPEDRRYREIQAQRAHEVRITKLSMGLDPNRSMSSPVMMRSSQMPMYDSYNSGRGYSSEYNPSYSGHQESNIGSNIAAAAVGGAITYGAVKMLSGNKNTQVVSNTAVRVPPKKLVVVNKNKPPVLSNKRIVKSPTKRVVMKKRKPAPKKRVVTKTRYSKRK